ncbi:MAG: aminotransferase class I/II-fold pyridoxal phosphate-dependent enzyme [Clostridia bacterium]|nr:aminotransferase class I/II-fold pyridoxal phosphate-dependent enzyme [Clostridia bacterium]
MFRNDYSVLADKSVLSTLIENYEEENVGYGVDPHSENAARLIRDFFGLKDAAVFFLAGGTVANMTVLSYLLRPYEAVISCDTAHINVHETGAVEASGHKILTAKNVDGKLTPDGIKEILSVHLDEHSVKPSVVYISFATETGSVYSKKELRDIRKTCDEYGLKLFIDGARLAVGLVSSDVTPLVLGEVADVFYAGGTKNGAIMGEAVVFKDAFLARDFRYHIKNRGAMLAKGFAVGIQFEALFTNGLYLRLAENARDTAIRLREGLSALGYNCENSNTNQQFFYFDCDFADTLSERYGCERWRDLGDRVLLRFVTTFSTTAADVDELIEFVRKNG